MSRPLTMARAVLFDLDGTLLDTLDDIASAGNAALAAEGFPGHPAQAYRWFIGDGVPNLVRRALPADAARDAALVDRCCERFREAYEHSWNVHTRPYDGVLELVGRIAAKGVPMAVLSNKPHDFTGKCVEEYFPPGLFRVVAGDRPGIARKPDPAGALAIAASLGVEPAAIAYLGDSLVDMTTAVRAGMDPIGAGWGFRTVQELRAHGARRVLDHPLELLDVLGLAP